MKAQLLSSLLWLAASMTAWAGPDSLRLSVQPLPATARGLLTEGRSGPQVFIQSGYYTWCPSLVRSPDGRWHLFHSRWPTERGFLGWLTFSEVARADAASPEGPFGSAATVVSAEPSVPGGWFDAHNPKVIWAAGRGWLYLIRTRGDGIDSVLRREISDVGYRHPRWQPELRANQRVFLATAERLEGPWAVADTPLLEPAGPICRLTVNPAVCARPEGGYLMVVKGDRPGATRFVRNQAIALAPKPEGPWVIQPRPMVADIDTEDACVWYDSDRSRYYAIFHSSEQEGFLGMMTSEDGLTWTRAAQFRLTDKVLHFSDGTLLRPSMMERPQVVLGEDGKPSHLAVACGLPGGRTGIVILRLSPGSLDHQDATHHLPVTR